MMTMEQYWFWLCNAPGMFREAIARLIKAYGSPEAIYYTDAKELEQKGLISNEQRRSLERFAEDGRFLDEMERLKEEKIHFVSIESEAYPNRLRKIPDPPFALYVRGTLPKETLPSAGIVGARSASEYGKKEARRFAAALAAEGVQIVSGMAHGIDAISAEGALSVGGLSFAVLGCGVDIIYPIENMSLYYAILEKGGGIISEYPPGTQPVSWQFPLRNRIISGLSDRLLVMEAKKRSGTLITVRYALEQGKDVYALPGRLIDKTSESCNQMIAEGAGILIHPDDLLAEIFSKPKVTVEAAKKEQTDEGKEEPAFQKDDPVPKKILGAIGFEAFPLETIVEKIAESPETTMSALCELELTGLVKEVSKNIYVRVF